MREQVSDSWVYGASWGRFCQLVEADIVTGHTETLPRALSTERGKLYISAVRRKLSLVFFFHAPPLFSPPVPRSSPHEEGVCERFFIKLTMPPLQIAPLPAWLLVRRIRPDRQRLAPDQ